MAHLSNLASLIATLTVLALLLRPNDATAPLFKRIYAFGDSFTDTGNTHSASGPSGFGHVSEPPYGVTFFHRPTNRYSDGRLVIDFVASSLSLPFLSPYTAAAATCPRHGLNFAVGGSTAIPHSFFVRNNLTLNATPQSIGTQLEWFDAFLSRCEGNKSGSGFDDALFWVGEIGANDYAYTLGSAVTGDTIRGLSIRAYSRFLTGLLKRGAKYVVIQGLPLTGCLPLAMTLAPTDDRDDLGCVKSANDASLTHNTAILNVLKALRLQYPNASVAYLDYYGAHRAVMCSPARYNLTEPFRACCGNGEPYNFDVFATCGTPSVSTACADPARYVNWDGVHLTEAMYEVLTDMFLRGDFCHPRFGRLVEKKLGRRGPAI